MATQTIQTPDYSQKIKDYLDSEDVIHRKHEEVLDMVATAGGDKEKLRQFLGEGYHDCESEQEFYTKMFEIAGNIPIYDLLGGRSRATIEWVLEKIANKCIQGKVLDICCGTGLETCFFKELGASEVIGIDINKRLLIEANRRIKKRSLENTKAIIGDRDKLKFPENYFDFVTCLNSILTEGEFPSYVPNSEVYYNFAIKHRIKQMARVLKKGGIAVVSTPVSEGYGEMYQNKFAYSFKSAGFSEILDKTEQSSCLEDRIFVEVLVSAKK